MGKDLLLKMLDGADYVTVAGLRSRTLAFNAQTVDVTHSESAGRWRELLAGAGVKRASISGPASSRMRLGRAGARRLLRGEVRDCAVVIPDFGTVSGPFLISALEIAGQHDREVTFDLTLESAARSPSRHCEETGHANRHRGEISAHLGGAGPHTGPQLGALAELEAAFAVEDLTALAERFGAGGSVRATWCASLAPACAGCGRNDR